MSKDYREISAISYAVRFYICYATIEATPIFKDEGFTWLFWQIIPIYTLFYIISYNIIGAMGYRSGDAPVCAIILYVLVYIPLALLTWLALLALTKTGVLPF